MATLAKRKRRKEYYLDCSACGDLQDAYTHPEQARDAIYRHQHSPRALDIKVPGEPGLFVRHRITIRLRKDDE